MQYRKRVILIFLGLAYLQISCSVAQGSKCQTSVNGIALVDHTFLSIQVKNIHFCYEKCKEKKACQSINYYRSTSVCHLNNRTITKKPEKKIVNGDSVYFEHPEPDVIGSHAENPAESCMEIKTTTNILLSGFYWVKHVLTRNISKIYCNMQTGVADGCFASPCKNQGTCHNIKYGDYNCTCTAVYAGVNCERLVIDKCQPNPCQNGGTCSNVGKNDYSCTCVAEYTGKRCDVVSSAECSSYTNISDPTRNVNQGISVKKCDSGLATKWYRFTGAPGVRIPTSCTLKSRCNTDATGWMQGAEPTVQNGIVSRTVCFNWSSNCCNWNVIIRVRNCGPYIVYELKKSPHCSLRYCTTN